MWMRYFGANTAGRPPARSRWETACWVCGCWRQSIGSFSLKSVVVSNTCCAPIPPGRIRSRISPRATGIDGKSKRLPGDRTPTKLTLPRPPSIWRARDSAGKPPRDHVGYFLIDRGACELKARFAYRPLWRERLLEIVLNRPNSVYFTSISIMCVAMLVLLLTLGLGGRLFSWWAPLAAALVLLPASALAVGLVNHLFTLLLRPRVVPKLEFKEAIPEQHSTFIVIPSMLTSASSAAVLLQRAERHYLANTLTNIRIGLLTDFADAESETMPADRIADSRGARSSLERFNEQYAKGGPDIFFLFHRRRLWNESERAGWAGNASEASFWSLIGCCVVRAIRPMR